MRPAFFSFLSLASLCAAAPAAASTWEIDYAHTEIAFGVKHMMVSNVRGAFKEGAGTLMVDDKDGTKSTLEVTIPAASIDTRQEKRDEHLRSADFLNVAKFPNITYRSTKMTKQGKGYKVEGLLTIRDVSKPVTLNVAEVSKPIMDPFGNKRVGATATAKFDREAFGLTWNKALEAGGFVVGKEVAVNIDVEFTEKAAAPAAPAPATASDTH